MRAVLVTTLFAGLCCRVLAQTPADPATAVSSNVPATVTVNAPPPAPPGQGRLSGHVFCDDTHRPARGALVMVVGLPSTNPAGSVGQVGSMATAHVRNDGSYSVQHLPPGNYTAIGIFPGYLSSVTDLLGEGSDANNPNKQWELLSQQGTFSIRAGGSATFEITLHRGGALSGQVAYSDGAPAPNISLLLEDATAKQAPDSAKNQDQQMAQAFAQRMFTQQSAATDDQGRFRLSGLKPGTYRLAATEPLSVGTDGGDVEGMGGIVSLMGIADARALRFFAGDTTHRASAKVFEVRPGDEVSGISITLPVDAFHEIHGTATAKDGRVINQGQITLSDTTDPQLTFRASIDRDGAFTLTQVPAGSYTLALANARITEPAPGGAPELPEQFRPRKPVAAFADASVAVMVQDHDVEGITLTAGEVPLPKDQSSEPASIAVTD